MRKSLLFIFLLACTCALAQERPVSWGAQGNGTYFNPILNGDWSDPDVIRVGEKYYMVASDFHFVGMQVLESDDLVNWRIVTQVYDRFDLPGWDESYTPAELRGLLDAYRGITHDVLFDNLVYFLKGVMPACRETGINMAIHPDDPPWDMFGLPRIITGMASYRRLFAAVPEPNNGITFCTGSLGAGRENDLVSMAAELAPRIHFAHLRQIALTGEHDFRESGHMTEKGSLDMYGIVKALVGNGFDGYVRPDHGRNIWGENGKPGYGLYDRALGAMYLAGLFEAVEKDLKKGKKNK